MSKNNSKQTATDRLAKLAAERAKLEAMIAAMDTEATELSAERTEEVKGLVNSLPEFFSLPSDTEEEILASLNDIAGYIRGRVKGTLGKLLSSGASGERTYKRLTADEDAAVKVALQAAADASWVNGKMATAQALADQYGVNRQTIYGRMSDMGLLSKRAVAVAAS